MTAIVRGVPDRFTAALVREPGATPLDVAKARAQHKGYCRALVALGYPLLELPALEEFPDCCFVEDTAIVAGGVGLVTRPGAPSRRGEVDAVAEALVGHVRLERMEAPATLDGGDCLRVGKRWYVGRSERTNAAGAARVKEVFGPLGYDVVEVAVEGALHLKSVCSELAGRVLVAAGAVPPGTFAKERVIEVPAEEAPAANVVSNRGAVLVAHGFPRTRERLVKAGFHVVQLDNSELRRADGALTCLSIRLG